MEAEPEDENPDHEQEEVLRNEPPLDSSDYGTDDESGLITFSACLPVGMQVAAPPPQSMLEFKSDTAKEMKGKSIMYNWAACGWWLGVIKRASADKNKLVNVDGVRQPANFVITYSDGSEGPACLTLGKYGEKRLCDAERWVLLERAPQ